MDRFPLDLRPRSVPDTVESTAILVVEVGGLRRRGSLPPPSGEAAVLADVTQRLVAAAPGAVVTSQVDGRLVLKARGLSKLEAVTSGDQLVVDARKGGVYGLRFPLAIGVSAMPDDGDDEAAVLESARLAADRASSRGGDMVLGYHEGMRKSQSSRPATVVSALLARPSLPVEFEPIVRCIDGTHVGLAACCLAATDLATTHSHLLEDAVRAGRLFELGERVRASTELAFGSVDDGKLWLTVGVHPAELLGVNVIVGETALRSVRDRLIIAVLPGTETLGHDAIAGARTRLRDAGARILVDDLDARADGIALLTGVRPDFVALSRGLVEEAAHSERAARAVASFATMARDLGAAVIAKHPNDAPTRQRLSELGITYLQGHAPGAAGRETP